MLRSLTACFRDLCLRSANFQLRFEGEASLQVKVPVSVLLLWTCNEPTISKLAGKRELIAVFVIIFAQIRKYFHLRILPFFPRMQPHEVGSSSSWAEHSWWMLWSANSTSPLQEKSLNSPLPRIFSANTCSGIEYSLNLLPSGVGFLFKQTTKSDCRLIG